MSTNTFILTTGYKTDTAQRFIDAVAADNYYLFTADSSDPANSAVIDSIIETNSEEYTHVYRSMIMGKKITSNDVSLVVRNIPYVANTLYDMYDDQVDLTTKDYFVVVNASSYYHIFKCLDNNNGANSTIEPNFADISGANTDLYQTSDGYRWKYICSFDSAKNLKFTTSDYVPLVANVTVQNSAVSGSINIIKIEDQGRSYNNYLLGSFKSTDIRVDGNSLLYQISNTAAATTNGYYTGCLIYLNTGTGAGQYKTVTDYVSNTSGNFIIIDSFFSTTPQNGTTYEIYPQVNVKGTGSETVTAVGRALVNALASNSIYRVEMLEPGKGYIFATANVAANATVGVGKVASIRPIIPPNGGHGANAANELFGQNIIVSMTLSGTEGNTIPANNHYRKVGVILNPLFSNVTINFSNVSVGTFLPGENVYKISLKRLRDTCTVNASSTMVTGANTSDWREQLTAGDEIVIVNDTKTSYEYLTVNNIVNSTVFYTTSNSYITSNVAILYSVNNHGSASVLTSNSTMINVSNCEPVFTNGDMVIGVTSGAVAYVNNTQRAGVTKDFTTYVQLYKYIGSLTYGQFAQNEVVYQGNTSIASALLFSTELNSGVLTMYTSNQTGSFSVSNTVTGSLSSATMTINNKYLPELVYGSGKPLYIQNFAPISRNTANSETFKITLNF